MGDFVARPRHPGCQRAHHRGTSHERVSNAVSSSGTARCSFSTNSDTWRQSRGPRTCYRSCYPT